jgi:hypothetical protein
MAHVEALNSQWSIDQAKGTLDAGKCVSPCGEVCASAHLVDAECVLGIRHGGLLQSTLIAALRNSNVNLCSAKLAKPLLQSSQV